MPHASNEPQHLGADCQQRDADRGALGTVLPEPIGQQRMVGFVAGTAELCACLFHRRPATDR